MDTRAKRRVLSNAAMCTCRSAGRVIAIVVGYLLLNGAWLHVNAQDASQPPAASDSQPVAMTECEGVDNCTTWQFLGTQGVAQWKTGEVASLSVEKTSGNTITIRRSDPTGSKAGLTAIYTGTVKHNRLSGEYKASWPGHESDIEGDWYAIVDPSPVNLPSMMHFCDVNCTTLQLKDGRYESSQTNNRYDPNWTDIWTVESFTPASVVLHRTETGNYPFSNVVIRGRMSPDKNSLVDAVNPFHGPGQPRTIKLAWGSALDTVPGSNAERNGAMVTNWRSVHPAMTSQPSDQPTLEDLNHVLTMLEILQHFNALLSDNK